ncbi:MAG: adenylate/guanylate cyclase domain-containing protein [Thermoplasmata archaeon]
MAGTRRLAAIMFTDMVGYTALTQDNEQHALALLEVHHRLLRPIFLQFGGREIKTIGDSFLVEFDSALDAASCAIAVQRQLEDYNASASEPDRFRLRIGVHLGDVVHTENDVLGDAINLASRIEPLAEPGGICVSEQVFAQVRNKIPNSFTKLAPVDLKNVRFPLDVYKVDLPWQRTAEDEANLPRGTARRLAVLPLANMSPDPQDEFFADGLTEEIMSELSSVPGLRVIARTSVMRFRGGAKGVSEIGKELRVGTILEGSVRRAGNRIRITAQLVDAGTEEHLWSGKYDRELVDIFAIQSEIAKEVAAALHIALPSAPTTGRRRPPNISAFKAYLRGRHLWNRRSDEHIRAALRCFEEALQLDPQYAEAYSGIADCYSILVDWGSMHPQEGSTKARVAAERAVQLDETMAEAHASLALALTREYRWDEGDREFQRATKLNPMYASAHQWYYMNLMCRGRREDAARELAQAEEADPLSPIILFHKGYLAWVTGNDDAALSSWNRVSELGEDQSVVEFHKLVFFAHRGMQAEARELLPKLNDLGRGWIGEALPAVAHGLLGQREEASRELDALLATAKERYVPAFRIAWVYAALGDADKFFEWLLRSADEMGNNPYEFISCPAFERMRADPRFQVYLRRCALTG